MWVWFLYKLLHILYHISLRKKICSLPCLLHYMLHSIVGENMNGILSSQTFREMSDCIRCFLGSKAISSSASVKFADLISRGCSIIISTTVTKMSAIFPRIFWMVLPFIQRFSLTIGLYLGSFKQSMTSMKPLFNSRTLMNINRLNISRKRIGWSTLLSLLNNVSHFFISFNWRPSGFTTLPGVTW